MLPARVPAPAAAPAPPGGSLGAWLAGLRVPYCVCSPWAALSGVGDEFDSMDELVRSVRSGMLLDIAALPTLSMVDRHGQVGLFCACWAMLCLLGRAVCEHGGPPRPGVGG